MSPFVLNPFLGAGGGGANGFYRPFTADHTQAGGTDTSNFPGLISGTYTFLKSVANGGKVDNTGLVNNIRPYNDAGVSSLLDFEIEKYDATTGQIIMWLRVPTLTHSSDATVYLKYGATADTSDVSNKHGVWGSNYKSVLHMGDGSTISSTDSSTHSEHWNALGPPAAATGQVYGGISVTDSTDLNSDADLASTSWTTLTAQVWYKPSSNTGQKGITSHGQASTPSFLIQNNAGTLQYYADGNYRDTSTSLSTGTWYHLAITLASSTTWKFYKNGSLLSTYTGGIANFGSANNQLFVGFGFNGDANGTYDEYHFDLAAHSADQVLAEYNNQNNPGSFWTAGSEVAL